MASANKQRSQLIGLIALCVAISLPFVLLYLVGKRSIINEVRAHAMGVAIATSAGLPQEAFARIVRGQDPEGSDFRLVQQFLNKVAVDNPDVRYVYTMKRSSDALRPAWIVEYAVDQSSRDANNNGVIDAEERFEPLGTPYNASRSPELINAFYGPTADRHITPDPPYPDLISGYAPVRDPDGAVVGIVGADITAQTVGRKLLAIQGVVFLVWLVLCLLILCVFMLYQKQREAYQRISQLSAELIQRNDMLRAANQELARMNAKFDAELQLAQRVQQGFLPARFPRHDRIVFDQYYLTCEVLGGDLYDVFEIDQDHIGLYMADVGGRGVSAALVSGLLRMAVSTIRHQQGAGTASLFVDMTRPDVVLRSINQLLHKEIPRGESITLIYGVFDLLQNRLLLASAGHPHPAIYSGRQQSAHWCRVQNGEPLGLKADQEYTCTSQPVEAGDLVLFYTDGLTKAVNRAGETFSEDRLLGVIGSFGSVSAVRLNESIREAVEHHRGGAPAHDDFTLLSVEIR
jgi:serine phosphatase RsbU (regulator of sigma subunit)